MSIHRTKWNKWFCQKHSSSITSLNGCFKTKCFVCQNAYVVLSRELLVFRVTKQRHTHVRNDVLIPWAFSWTALVIHVVVVLIMTWNNLKTSFMYYVSSKCFSDSSTNIFEHGDSTIKKPNHLSIDAFYLIVYSFFFCKRSFDDLIKHAENGRSDQRRMSNEQWAIQR